MLKKIMLTKLVFICFISLLSFNAQAETCTDGSTDDLVQKKALELALKYKAPKFGITFASLIMKPYKFSTIVLYVSQNGDPQAQDLVGTVVVNMEKCTVQSSLVSIVRDQKTEIPELP